MSVTGLPALRWTLQRRRIGPAAIAMLALVAVASWVLLGWQRDADAELDRRELLIERAAARTSTMPSRRPTPRPALSAAGSRQLQEQMALLNRDWATLLDVLTPRGRDVKMLGLDINPATGAVRVTGQASTSTLANAYAASLGKHAAVVHRVRLLVLERRPDGVRFEVGAQWVR